MKTIGVVVPAYNEEGRLADTVHSCFSTLEGAGAPLVEVIVVDDGSTDGTLEVARTLSAEDPRCRVRSNGANRGKGYSLRDGFLASAADLVFFLDADGEIPPTQMLNLLSAHRRSGADLIVGKKPNDASRPPHRRLATALVRTLARRVLRLPISDTQTGIKLLNRRSLEAIVSQTRENDFLFDLELALRARRTGLRFDQVPVALESRGRGRIGAKRLAATGLQAMALLARFAWVSPTPVRTGEVAGD